jgi:hypothetical protein
MPLVTTQSGPGTAVGAADAANAIALQTVALAGGIAPGQAGPPSTGALELLTNVIQGGALNSIELKNEVKILAKALDDLNTVIGSIAVQGNATNAILTMQVANQIQTNNFQVQATKEALARTDQPEPTLPSPAVQIRESVKDSAVLMQVGQAEGFVNNQLIRAEGGMISYLGEFLPSFDSISQWFKDKYKAIFDSAGTDASRSGSIISKTPPTA